MGKRELLLIVGFILFGAAIYQFTKPATAPGQRGFSISRIIDEIRREVGGNRANAEVVSTNNHPLSPTVSELRINITSAQITVVGEDRGDMASELRVRSTGYDDAEAQLLAKSTTLGVENLSESVIATINYPKPGSQRATLVLRVPSRLRIRVEPNIGRLEIGNVAGAEIVNARGETIIKGVAARVTLTHRGGDLTVDDVGSVRLNARASDVRLSKVRGEAMLQLLAGDLRAGEIVGPLEIESNDTDVTLEKLGDVKGVLRVNAVAGQLTVRGLRSEARVDGRGSEIDVQLERPTALSIYNSNEPIDITVPPGGFQLDAVAASGEITIAPSLQSAIAVSAAEEPEKEQRAAGKVNGGGPAITIRSTRGDIRVNAPADSQ